MTGRVSQQARQRLPLLQVAFGCLLALFTLFFPAEIFAEDEILFDEVSVFFNVSGLGGKELEAVIKEEEVYLSVTDLFEYLKINHKISDDNETVSGFFLFENNRYVIDKTNNGIVLGDKTYPLKPDDLIQTLTGLYLRTAVLGKVFGLDCVFNFRSLSVNLNTKLDLPVIRERRQEMMRSNLSKLKREIIADTILSRKYPAFHFGNFDWAVTSTQQQQGPQDTRLNLRLGTIIAGGETNLALNYDTRQHFKLRQQNYLWRYVNNDRATLRQVKAGKIPVQSTASLYAPVLGVQLTNTPTTYRRSFGTYTLSDFTDPEWIVELYINNVLVDYVKSDASGFFTFQVPMIYGNTAIKFRFLGPWGEERFKEQKIIVPANFLPKNELEYTFSAGMLEDGQQSRFSRLDLKYGLGNRITVGTGLEYLSALSTRQIMPFVNASLRISSNVLLSADYTYGVRGKAILNYRMPADILLELNYSRFQKGQQAISQNFLEERKAMISRPFRIPGISGFSRLSINQVIYPNTQQVMADLLLSASIKGISANLSTYAQMIQIDYPNIYSKLALAFRLPSRLTLRPQLQYGYKFQRINEVRIEMEKQVLERGFLNLSYQNNFNHNSRTFNLGLRFDLSFARASFSARHSGDRAVFSHSLSGGALVDAKTKYFNMNNRSNVGKGGLVIYPFLDLNLNNRRDKNEPKIQGLELKINGGRIQNNVKDTTVRVFDLEPYNSYLLELSRSSFDNIAWQLKNATYKVTIEPNNLKLIEVPVMVSGEVSGMVYGAAADSSGQGRILVNFYREGIFAGRTLSESDGYFNYLGLSPGSYTASIDSAQLSKLKMFSAPASMLFDIKLNIDGDVAGDLDFKLTTKDQHLAERRNTATEAEISAPDEVETPTVKSIVAKDNPDAIADKRLKAGIFNKADSAINLPMKPEIISGKKEEPPLSAADESKSLSDAGFSIKINAIGNRTAATNLRNNLIKQYGHNVKVYFEGTNSYQLSIMGFESRNEAELFLPVLNQHGLNNSFITAPRAVFKPAAAENRTFFQILTIKARDKQSLKQQQELILKTIKKTAFPLNDMSGFGLTIPGYTDSISADKDRQKLIAAGIDKGYISRYKLKQVNTNPGSSAIDGSKGTDKKSLIPGKQKPAAEAGQPKKRAENTGTADESAKSRGMLRFRVVAGLAKNEAEIRIAMALILKTLNTNSFAVKEGEFFRLHVSEFNDRNSAEIAHQKLIAAGLLQGYISSYKEQPVLLYQR